MRRTVVVAALILLAACADSTGPSAPPDDPVAPPAPSFRAACAWGHNSGSDCRILATKMTAAATAMAYECSKGFTPRCVASTFATAIAIQQWDAGRDLYGHHSGADCNWCTDPPEGEFEDRDNWWSVHGIPGQGPVPTAVIP